MTAAWLCASPGRETSIHDTEREDASEVAWLLGSKTATVAVWYRVELEPPVRLGYWDRAREQAA